MNAENNEILFWVSTPNGGRYEETKTIHKNDSSEAMLGEVFRDWLWDEVIDYGWDSIKKVEETNHIKLWVKTPNGGLYEQVTQFHEDDSSEEMVGEFFRDWLMDEVVDYGWHKKE